GLVAGGDGGGGGGGVGAEGGAVIGLSAAHHREVQEAQGILMLQDGAVAAHAGAVYQGGQIVVGALNLGIAHAVADEQENVLGGAGGSGFGSGSGGGDSGSAVAGGSLACGRAAGRKAEGQGG